MRNNDNNDIKLLLDEIFVKKLNEERDALRKEARENILHIQHENRKSFNNGRVLETIYEIGELVAIKRIQFGTDMKSKPKYLGPYKVVRKLNDGCCEVKKVGECEGSRRCNTVAEYMKPWSTSFGSNDASGGPNRP